MAFRFNCVCTALCPNTDSTNDNNKDIQASDISKNASDVKELTIVVVEHESKESVEKELVDEQSEQGLSSFT